MDKYTMGYAALQRDVLKREIECLRALRMHREAREMEAGLEALGDNPSLTAMRQLHERVMRG